MKKKPPFIFLFGSAAHRRTLRNEGKGENKTAQTFKSFSTKYVTLLCVTECGDEFKN